jgi:hypothetical protein
LAAVMAVLAFILQSSLGVHGHGSSAPRTLTTFALMVLAGLVVIYTDRLVDQQRHVSALLPVAAIVVHFPLALMLRHAFAGLLRWEGLHRRILVIGSGPIVARIEEVIRRRAGRLALVGCMDGLVAEGGQLAGYARARGVDEIIIAEDEAAKLPLNALLDCRLRGFSVTDYASFHEREAGELDLDYSRARWMIFSDGFRLDRGRMMVKRIFDVVVSLVLLLLTLPVTVATAALIRLESPGSVFYRQERVGLDGRSFFITKFRSMRADAEREWGPSSGAPASTRSRRCSTCSRAT